MEACGRQSLVGRVVAENLHRMRPCAEGKACVGARGGGVADRQCGSTSARRVQACEMGNGAHAAEARCSLHAVTSVRASHTHAHTHTVLSPSPSSPHHVPAAISGPWPPTFSPSPPTRAPCGPPRTPVPPAPAAAASAAAGHRAPGGAETAAGAQASGASASWGGGGHQTSARVAAPPSSSPSADRPSLGRAGSPFQALEDRGGSHHVLPESHPYHPSLRQIHRPYHPYRPFPAAVHPTWWRCGAARSLDSAAKRCGE